MKLLSSMLLTAGLVLVLTPQQVHAWGKIGHEMVANIAWSRLSNSTQTWVATALGPIHHDDVGSPLAAVSTWADRVRFTKAYHWSTPLHYVDIQDDVIVGGCPVVGDGEFSDCWFEYARDCVDDVCAAGAIANYSTQLVSQRELSAAAANVSLKFLTHFVGDIHQPLHASRKTDKGGNTIHVHFNLDVPKIAVPDRGDFLTTAQWNLHSIWDDGIIEKALEEFFNGEREEFEHDLLERTKGYASSGQLNLWLACGDGRQKACTTVWAQESFGAALSWAYRDVDGLEIQENGTISEDYFHSRLEVVKRRIVAAGVRLARTLELVHTDTRARSYLRPISKKTSLEVARGSRLGS
jgi:hypothetical protein